MKMGERIKLVRKNFGSQSDFGELLGVTRVTVTNYELGRTGVPLEHLIKIAELGNVSLDWLILGRNLSQGEGITEQEKKLLNLWGSLSEGDKVEVLFLVNNLSRSSNESRSKGAVLEINSGREIVGFKNPEKDD